MGAAVFFVRGSDLVEIWWTQADQMEIGLALGVAVLFGSFG